MSVQKQIKENLLKEIYTDIDKMYDYMSQHFILDEDHEELIIKHLNKMKDQFYAIATNSKLFIMPNRKKSCSCAKSACLEQIRSFESREEAQKHAYEWADSLNNTFCGKHGFDIVEVDDNFVISVETGGFVEACEL